MQSTQSSSLCRFFVIVFFLLSENLELRRVLRPTTVLCTIYPKRHIVFVKYDSTKK